MKHNKQYSRGSPLGIILEMPSYTYAVKAEGLLRSRGIPVEMLRREEGCGYNLRIYSDSAADILDDMGIPFTRRQS